MTLGEILFRSMKPIILEIIENNCNEMLSNPDYKFLRILEDGEIKGFCCYKECNGYRELAEAHYLGKNPYIWLKIWRFMTKNAQKMVILAQKNNKRVIEFYKNMNFKIIKEDKNNYLLERSN